MKKYFYLLSLISFIFWGCEKDFDQIVQPQRADYQVTNISSFKNFNYVVGDSLVTIFIWFRQQDNISDVYANIYSSDGKKLNANPVRLFDDGSSEHGDPTANDNRYYNKYPLSQSYPNGSYKVEYFVTDNSGETKQTAIHNFTFNNGQDNVAPVLSNLVVEPDTIVVGNSAELISLSVEASDSNGLGDIQNVYFIVTRPDGTSNGIQVQMLDNGNSGNGDQTAGDGIYSLIVEIAPSNTKGTYTFEFQARDRGGLLSNTITHFIVVQ